MPVGLVNSRNLIGENIMEILDIVVCSTDIQAKNITHTYVLLLLCDREQLVVTKVPAN